jgi:hypothetical protein
MYYELWWVSADGQQAIRSEYPARSYRTTDEAERAIHEAQIDMLDAQAEADPHGEDPEGVARILAGRWEVTETEEGRARVELLASIPGGPQPVWGGWVWRTDDGDEWTWSKRRTEEACLLVVAEVAMEGRLNDIGGGR